MKRALAAAILLFFVGVVSTIGVAWLITLREFGVPPRESAVRFEKDGWRGVVVRAPGEVWIQACSAEHVRWEYTEFTDEADEIGSLPRWSTLDKTATEPWSWWRQYAAGWPMPALRYSGESVKTEEELASRIDLLMRPMAEIAHEQSLSFDYRGAIHGGLPYYDQQLLPARPMWLGLVVNSLIFAAGWAALFALLYPFRLIRPIIRRRRGRCSACGYDRRGDRSALCPECGEGRWTWPRVVRARLLIALGALCLMLTSVFFLLGFSFAQGPSYSPIHYAAFRGDAEQVTALLAQSVDVELPVPNGLDYQTAHPLFLAATSGTTETIIALIEAGADPNPLSQNRVTALAEVTRRDDKRSFDRLIEAGADVNLGYPNALLKAIQLEHDDLAKRLLELGAVPYVFHIEAAARRRTTTMLELLVDHGADLAKDGQFAHFRVDHDPAARPVWEYLMAAGADPNAQADTGETALHFAAEYGSPDYVEFLIEHGADANVLNYLGANSLSVASDEHERTWELLLEAGADVNIVPNIGSSPLGRAVMSENDRLVTLLLDNGADPDLPNSNGESPLYVAATPSIVRLLIDHGADVNFQNEYGQTALMDAVRWNKPELVKVLLDSGADPTLKDDNGASVLNYSKSGEMTQMLNEAIAEWTNATADEDERGSGNDDRDD